ncbi:hypothetical protein NMY22_g17353 [Coprinellus aureogranulatus]|nr:hypothetical protein NMY22_g17353 [Coprinellus aureogranulatus]
MSFTFSVPFAPQFLLIPTFDMEDPRLCPVKGAPHTAELNRNSEWTAHCLPAGRGLTVVQATIVLTLTICIPNRVRRKAIPSSAPLINGRAGAGRVGERSAPSRPHYSFIRTLTGSGWLTPQNRGPVRVFCVRQGHGIQLPSQSISHSVPILIAKAINLDSPSYLYLRHHSSSLIYGQSANGYRTRARIDVDVDSEITTIIIIVSQVEVGVAFHEDKICLAPR